MGRWRLVSEVSGIVDDEKVWVVEHLSRMANETFEDSNFETAEK